MEVSRRYKEKEPFNLCICCIGFKTLANAYLTILVNDIAISAIAGLFAFIMTDNNIFFALPGLIFFVFSSLNYMHWRVENQRFTKIA